MIHPADTRASNPRVQCDVCGKWSRLHTRDGQQFMYGGCHWTGNDHTAAGESQDVCDECCKGCCEICS
jgi:hypothetical protein